MQPGKGYSITSNRPNPCPEIPMIFVEHKVAVTPFDKGFRVGSTMEFNGYDKSINNKRLSLLTQGAAQYLQDPIGDKPGQEWCGWRPLTHDGIPCIGQSPTLPNAWIAAGHSMLGTSMAPATGKLLAELLTGNQTHIDSRPYKK